MDRPILFSAPMIRALREGRKTQTRRILKPQPEVFDDLPSETIESLELEDRLFGRDGEWIVPRSLLRFSVGDRLWVRETGNWCRPMRGSLDGPTSFTFYAADSHRGRCEFFDDKNKPAIFMPRWASRLTLIVTDVRVERLQAIGASDAIAEGLFRLKATGRYVVNQGEQYAGLAKLDPRLVFQALWESINGPDSWDDNPWVAALTFTVHQCNIDSL